MLIGHRMFKSVALTSFLSLILIAPIAKAEIKSQYSPSASNGIYIGLFGGGGHASNINASQSGTDFFPPFVGGPLVVHATGNASANASFIGAHIGYQLLGWSLDSCRRWCLLPAVELEGYYLNTHPHGDLNNPTNRLPEHFFVDSFPVRSGVVLANMVFAFKYNPMTNPLVPYLGVGIGAADISIHEANSRQVAPAEFGINHFNSRTRDSDWPFAAQAKAGLRINLDNNWRFFAEYRLLYLAGTNYTFGPTIYPTHVPTTTWNVNLGNMIYNMGDIGLEYSI